MITNVDVQSDHVAPQAEPCFRLIYRSRSLLSQGQEPVEAGLAEVLRVSRVNNRKRGVTGALMFYEYKEWFAQVLEGPQTEVEDLFAVIEADERHKSVEIREAANAPDRLFNRWAMALIAEHGQSDAPLVAIDGNISEAEPWRVSEDQEKVLTQLRDITRGYGRSY